MLRSASILGLCLLAACGPAREADPDRMKVALLTPGPVSDAGWNAAAYEGLEAIGRELGATTRQLETATPAEFERGFRVFASQGFDLVFGHGYEFQDAAAAVGEDFPDTIFVTTSGATVRENVAPMVFRLEQATYLLGVLAARLSRDGEPLGVIGGVEIPSVASTFLAYEAGVHRVDPERRVVTTYIGNWEDVSAAKEAALAQIRQGTRYIFHNADAAGLGVFRAATESHGVYVFGSNKDQATVAPEVVLASAVLDIPSCFLLLARRVRDGRFVAQPMEFGMADGVVTLVWNPELSRLVPEPIRKELDELAQRITDGELEVPHMEF